jgi:hypothetical protein
MGGRQEVQEWEEKETILSILMSVWNPQTHVRLIHQRENHHLENQSSEEVR